MRFMDVFYEISTRFTGKNGSFHRGGLEKVQKSEKSSKKVLTCFGGCAIMKKVKQVTEGKPK